METTGRGGAGPPGGGRAWRSWPARRSRPPPSPCLRLDPMPPARACSPSARGLAAPLCPAGRIYALRGRRARGGGGATPPPSFLRARPRRGPPAARPRSRWSSSLLPRRRAELDRSRGRGGGRAGGAAARPWRAETHGAEPAQRPPRPCSPRAEPWAASRAGEQGGRQGRRRRAALAAGRSRASGGGGPSLSSLLLSRHVGSGSPPRPPSPAAADLAPPKLRFARQPRHPEPPRPRPSPALGPRRIRAAGFGQARLGLGGAGQRAAPAPRRGGQGAATQGGAAGRREQGRREEEGSPRPAAWRGYRACGIAPDIERAEPNGKIAQVIESAAAANFLSIWYCIVRYRVG